MIPISTMYDDGICDIVRITNTAAAGDKPNYENEVIARHAFTYLHIGVTRHYESMKAGQSISWLIECYQDTDITTNDRAIIDRKSYRILRIEHTFNKDGIRVTRLTLGVDE